MRRLWNRYRARIVESYLRDLHAEMDGRIRAGDPDFDDVIYRSRDAVRTLLDIREGVSRDDADAEASR